MCPQGCGGSSPPFGTNLLRSAERESLERDRAALARRQRRGLDDRERTHAGDGRVFRTRSIRNAFEYATEAAGLGAFHFHDTRHHFASWFMLRGGSLQELKEILGHADITMTLRYAHLSPAHLRSAMLRTERTSAQNSTQEAVAVLEESRK